MLILDVLCDGSVLSGLSIRTEGYPGYLWNFQLWREADPVTLVAPYVPPTSIDDPALAALATTWLQTCHSKHAVCRSPDRSYRPTRLIKIIDANQVKLVWPAEEPSGPYVAFSHCWGKAEALKLVRSNVERFRAGLGLDQLPASYQEAILLCLKMGFQHIWIDSLCIIQDSTTDWKREAMDMKLVYGNADLNICSATATDNAGTSFVARKADLLKPAKVSVRREGRLAETFQLIHEGRHQLWWHCHQQLACEVWPHGAPKGPLGRWWSQAREMKEEVESTATTDLCTMWNQRVEEYSRMHLTKENDRVVAFAGITQSFGESHGIAYEYLAGLWHCHLPAALCWKIISITQRTATYRAPSWSWVSLNGPLRLQADPDLLQANCCASIERVWPHRKDGKDRACLAMGGVIEVRGQLIECRDAGALGELSSCEFSVIGAAHKESLEGVDRQLFLDEYYNTDEPMISYMDNLGAGAFGNGLLDQAHRKTMHLRDAHSRFCFFLIIDAGASFLYRFRGLVLYRPVGHSALFHRVGYWTWKKLPDGLSLDQLPLKHPKKTIPII
ncbi:hypothetical protein ACJZ2D_006301 [Fusarium nematophilum]